jgi:thiol-disulfide isomerase/thioredoxin
VKCSNVQELSNHSAPRRQDDPGDANHTEVDLIPGTVGSRASGGVLTGRGCRAVIKAKVQLECAAHARGMSRAHLLMSPLRYTQPFAFVFIVALMATAAAQSGRKLNSPPPPPSPPAPPSESLSSKPAYVPTGPPSMSVLPESLLSRELKAIDNSSFRLADFDGKVIVVNVWATWCGPCRREVPDSEKVRKEYAGREVEFIALTTEDPFTERARVEKFVRDTNFGFRIGWADPATARTLMNGRNAIPQTLVVDKHGQISSHWRGYSAAESRDRLKQAIEKALSAEFSASGK